MLGVAADRDVDGGGGGGVHVVLPRASPAAQPPPFPRTLPHPRIGQTRVRESAVTSETALHALHSWSFGEVKMSKQVTESFSVRIFLFILSATRLIVFSVVILGSYTSHFDSNKMCKTNTTRVLVIASAFVAKPTRSTHLAVVLSCPAAKSIRVRLST